MTVKGARRCSPSWRGAGCDRRSRTCSGRSRAPRQPSLGVMCRLHLEHLDHLDAMIAKLDFQLRTDDAALSTPTLSDCVDPRVRGTRFRGGGFQDRRRPRGLVPVRRTAGLLGRAVPRQPRIGRQTTSRTPTQGQPASAAGPGRMRLGRGAHRRFPARVLPPPGPQSSAGSAAPPPSRRRSSRSRTS